MTATDQPTPRVGDTITTAEQLDALPVGTVVVEGDHTTPDEGAFMGVTTIPGVFHRFPDGWYVVAGYGARAPEEFLPALVLHRPDAPHSAPVGEGIAGRVADAVRAALDAVRAAFAADPAGELELTRALAMLDTTDAQRSAIVQMVAVGIPADAMRAAATQWARTSTLTATATGNAVDREALADVLEGHRLVSAPYRHPYVCACGWQGSEMWTHQADVILAARGDALPSVSAEQVDGDVVERAARAVYERIERHWPGGCDGPGVDCDSDEDCAADVARAALAAARAGEPGCAEYIGAEVDREALAEVMYEAARGTGSRHTARSWPNASEGSHTPWRAAANAAADFLAARGAAAPTVTAEQFQQATERDTVVRGIAEDCGSTPEWIVRQVAHALGIEVRG